jgi:hypothetical protein
MSDSHRWHLRPWVAAWLTPRIPAAASTTALPEIPEVSGIDPRQLCRLFASPMRWLHTPPVATRLPSGEPAGFRTTRARFPCHTSLGSFRELEASSTARSRPRRPRFRSAIALRAATSARVLPPRAQLPTCVHAPTGSARPEHLFSYSLAMPRPHAAYRFLQLGDPRAHLRVVQTPRCYLLANQQARTGSGLPYGPPLAGFPQARGRIALHAFATPRHDDRSSDGFTPT